MLISIYPALGMMFLQLTNIQEINRILKGVKNETVSIKIV